MSPCARHATLLLILTLGPGWCLGGSAHAQEDGALRWVPGHALVVKGERTWVEGYYTRAPIARPLPPAPVVAGDAPARPIQVDAPRRGRRVTTGTSVNIGIAGPHLGIGISRGYGHGWSGYGLGYGGYWSPYHRGWHSWCDPFSGLYLGFHRRFHHH